jgi:hypothetical protein
MTVRSSLGSHAATGVLIGAIALFSLVFLRAEETLVNLACIVAVLGWVGWWYERGNEPTLFHDGATFTAHDTGSSQPEAQKQPSLAAAFARPNMGTPDTTSKEQNAEDENETGTDADIEADVSEVVEQVCTARVEAEQAVNSAIDSFSALVEQARQIEECSQEVAGWQHNSNPMHQATVEFLVERSSALGQNVNRLVMAFQFNDLLSQRLCHTEKSLHHIAARLRGETNEPLAKSFTFAEGPVSYGAEQQNDNQIELF